MHPVLFSINLERWQFPLLPWLALFTVGAGAVVFLALHTRRHDLALLFAVAGVVGAVAAFVLRDQRYVAGEFVVTSFGACLGLALLLGWRLTTAFGVADGLERNMVNRCFFATIIAGFIGARLGFVATSWPGTFARALDFRAGGLLGYAGLLAGLLGLALFVRRSEVRWQQLADAAAPSIVLGALIAQIGCYLLGSGFGRPLGENAPGWLRALGTFPRWPEDVLSGAGSPAWTSHVASGLIQGSASTSAPVHPTQLYQASALIVLLGVVLGVRRLRGFSGEAFLVAVLGYGVLRFVADSWRADPQRWLVGPHLPMGWALTLGLLVLAAALVVGPVRAIRDPRWRRAAQGVALASPLILHLVYPESDEVVALSVCQWLALATATWSGICWERWERGIAGNAERM